MNFQADQLSLIRPFLKSTNLSTGSFFFFLHFHCSESIESIYVHQDFHGFGVLTVSALASPKKKHENRKSGDKRPGTYRQNGDAQSVSRPSPGA